MSSPDQQETVTIITIDGPAGAGKSTVATSLAKRLRFFYLDTGAMYRAMTLKALRSETDMQDEAALEKLAAETVITLQGIPPEPLKVLLDGEDVTVEIRTPTVTNATHHIAASPRLRQIMVRWQQEVGRRQNCVVEGRDAGTVIFPDALFKFYLDTDFEERVRRRINDLTRSGHLMDQQQLRTDMETRDLRDIKRQVGPLKQADGAVVIDATHQTVEEVVAKMLKVISTPGDGRGHRPAES